jgi:hypothetical protein
MTKTEVKGGVKQMWKKPLHTLARQQKNADGTVTELPKFAKGFELTFVGTFDAYDDISEVKAANDMPSDKEIVDFRNTQRRNNARTKAQNAQVEAVGLIEPSMENDDQIRLKAVYDSIMAGKKKTHEEARALAAATVEAEWDDE